MFLNRLNMKEKTAFLMMAHHIAHADGEFCSREQLVVDKYCMEMQVDDVEYSASEFNLADQLAAFEKDSHKKIALLELMALVFSDEVYHPAEKAVIDEIVEIFELNPNLAIVYKEWAKSILSLFIQGEALIHI